MREASEQATTTKHTLALQNMKISMKSINLAADKLKMEISTYMERSEHYTLISIPDFSIFNDESSNGQVSPVIVIFSHG